MRTPTYPSPAYPIQHILYFIDLSNTCKWLRGWAGLAASQGFWYGCSPHTRQPEIRVSQISFHIYKKNCHIPLTMVFCSQFVAIIGGRRVVFLPLLPVCTAPPKHIPSGKKRRSGTRATNISSRSSLSARVTFWTKWQERGVVCGGGLCRVLWATVVKH